MCDFYTSEKTTHRNRGSGETTFHMVPAALMSVEAGYVRGSASDKQSSCARVKIPYYESHPILSFNNRQCRVGYR